MAIVVLGRELARQFTGGETRLEAPPEAATVRDLVRALDAAHPGLGPALRTGMAVAIDGLIYQDAMLESIAEAGEVCFIPAIEGG